MRAINTKPLFFATVVMLFVPACGNNMGDDLDLDGISNNTEQALGTDPADPDTDGDGLSDGFEYQGTTSPIREDSDGDGINDGLDQVHEPAYASSGNDLEPNDRFYQAVAIRQQNPDRIIASGRINPADDIDLFQLGPLNQGDRIVAAYFRDASAFQPQIALFNQRGDIIRLGSKSTISLAPGVVLIDQIIRIDAENCLLGISTPYGEARTGRYHLEIFVERNKSAPKPAPQKVYLDFDGGRLDRAILNTLSVRRFDAESIHPSYASHETLIKTIAIETVRVQMGELSVEILNSDEHPEPERPFTRILVGGTNDRAFGAAEAVDPNNARRCDDGVVFAETFTMEAFGFVAPPEALGVAVGNVIAHEIGHLLGLHHVNDPEAIMDESSPAANLLLRQHFCHAPIAPSVFPIGYQNAQSVLQGTVGTRTSE